MQGAGRIPGRPGMGDGPVGAGSYPLPVGAGGGGSSDRSVQATNDDATISKLSCVQHGYFQDNFVRFFVRRPTRRSPVIHRGYFARWAGLRILIDQFLDTASHSPAEQPLPHAAPGQHQPEILPSPEGAPPGNAGGLDKLQIVSLGAGFDTLFFQLQEEGRAPGRYIEIDFPEVTSKKAAIISSKPQLMSCLESLEMAPKWCGVRSARYALAAADLRDTGQLQTVLAAAGADFSAATLILAECVLIYMDPKTSDSLVAWAAKAFSSAAFVVYEQIRPDDSFGEQMVQNLEARGCPLMSLRHTPSLESKEERFLRHGFQEAEAVDMDKVYSQCIPQSQKGRIEGLEIFDEFEEWHMMQEHYCIAYGIRQPDSNGSFKNFGFNLRKQKQ